jgi:uncharacterized membrane protein YcaP (DUF421 family)
MAHFLLFGGEKLATVSGPCDVREPDALLRRRDFEAGEASVDANDLLMTALRASLVYFFLLVVIRILGKRSVGALGAFDLLVALMLGEVVDEAIFGDVALPKALLAISVVALWHFVNGWLSYRSRVVHRLTEGQPTVLVAHGEIDRDALAREHMNELELRSQLRMLSVDDVQEVERATLETNGHVSVIKKEESRPLRKGDLAEARAGSRRARRASA